MTRTGPLDAAVALTRFGMGARPGEIATVAADPRGWLEAQARPGGAPVPAGAFETSEQRLEAYQDYQAEAARARRMREAPAAAGTAAMGGGAPPSAAPGGRAAPRGSPPDPQAVHVAVEALKCGRTPRH